MDIPTTFHSLNSICLVVSHSKQANLFTNTIIWDFLYWQKSTEISETQSSPPPTSLLLSSEESCKILNQMLVISLWNFRITINLDYSKCSIYVWFGSWLSHSKNVKKWRWCISQKLPTSPVGEFGKLPTSQFGAYLICAFSCPKAPPDSPRADF